MNKIKTLLAISTMAFSSVINAQQADIGVSDATVSPAPIINPTGISVSFKTGNYGSQTISYTGIVTAGAVQIKASLLGLRPADNFSLSNDVYVVSFGSQTNNSGITFSFSYNQATNEVIATLTSNWPRFITVGDVVVRIGNLVATHTSTPASPTNGLNVNVTAPPDYGGSSSNNNTNQYTFASSALPINLSSFTAEEKACGTVSLQWQTAKEENASHFDVEQSADGRTFNKVKQQPAQNSPRGARYTTTVGQVEKEGFYRLKMIDFDGQYTYSGTQKVILSCVTEAVNVSPNPAHNSLNVSGLKGTEEIQLVNMLGQKVLTKKAISGKLYIDISSLSAGNYQLLVIDNEMVQNTFKIVKNIPQ